MEEQNKIYVGNLSYDLTEDDLKNVIVEAGIEVKAVRIISDRETGRSKGFAFVDFENDEDTQKAIELLEGKDVGGRQLRVNKARKKQPRSNDYAGGGSGNQGYYRGF